MTLKMITCGIVVTNMSVITHQDMTEMIDVHTKFIDITMTGDPTTKGEMMTIDELIVCSVMNDGTSIGNPRHLDSSNIIVRLEMSQSHKMFDNRVMRTEKPVGRRYLIAISAEKMDNVQISVRQSEKGRSQR